jgi:hypothetical protein
MSYKTWSQCYKTFLSVIYEFSYFLDLAGKACRGKHSSLLRKLVNYGQKVLKDWHLEKVRDGTKGLESIHNRGDHLVTKWNFFNKLTHQLNKVWRFIPVKPGLTFVAKARSP